MPLNIELKMSTITESDRLADELLQVLSHVKNKSTSINPLISSFNLSVLQNLRQRSDEIRLGYLSNQQNGKLPICLRLLKDITSKQSTRIIRSLAENL